MEPDFYRIIESPAALQPYVRRLMVADCTEPIDMATTPAPTGYIYLGWVFAGEVSATSDNQTMMASASNFLHVAGQIQHQDISVRYNGRAGHIIAECTAVGFFQLTGISGQDVTGYAGAPPPNSKMPMDRFEALCSGAKFSETSDRAAPRLAAFLDFLNVLAASPKEAPAYVHDCAAEIERNDGAIKIASIIEQLDVSRRQLDRSFTKIVGITPKYFASILQLNKALEAMFSNDEEYLTALAQKAGYYDQAHFIHVMQKFFNRSPQEFLQSDTELMATFLGKSRSI